VRVEVRLLLVVLGIVLFMSAPLLLFGDALEERFRRATDLAWLRAHGAWASVVAIALLVGDILLPVPTSGVMAALGMLHGPLLGGLIGGAGSILAGLVAYWSCRLAGRRAAMLLLGAENLVRLGRFFSRVGLAAVALSRWVPVLPEALACLAGLARMPAPRFTAALAVGSLAMSFSFAALGDAYAEQPALGLLWSAVVPCAAWPLLRLGSGAREGAAEEREGEGTAAEADAAAARDRPRR